MCTSCTDYTDDRANVLKWMPTIVGEVFQKLTRVKIGDGVIKCPNFLDAFYR